MFNRNYVALSFYEKQAKQSIIRAKLLAELQSKFIITDIKNVDLRNELDHLKIQNKLLRDKLQEKTYLQAVYKRKRAETALVKANQYLNNKRKMSRALQTYSELGVPLKIMENSLIDNQISTHRKNKNNSSCCQSGIKLSKAAYYNPNQEPPLLNRNQKAEREVKKVHKRQFSFKQPQKHILSDVMLTQSKGIIEKIHQNQSQAIEGRKIKQQPEINEQLKRWKSDGSFANQSDLCFGSKANPSGKRKTYLSIVSVSSKGNRL